MPVTRHRVALPALLLLGACAASGPEVLQTAPDAVPPGFQRVTCDLRGDQGAVRFALPLPRDYRPTRIEGADCAWTARARVEVHSPDPTDQDHDVDLVVTLDHVDDGESLQDLHDAQERFLVEGDVPGGDDSVLHLDLDEGVPTYGATIGDRLSYLCFCDGQDNLYRYAQADGVRLGWTSVEPLERRTDRWLEQALRGAGQAR